MDKPVSKRRKTGEERNWMQHFSNRRTSPILYHFKKCRLSGLYMRDLIHTEDGLATWVRGGGFVNYTKMAQLADSAKYACLFACSLR